MIKTSHPFPSGAFEATEKVLAMVDPLDPAAFIDLPRFDALDDGATVEQDSRSWAARFFRAGANRTKPQRRQSGPSTTRRPAAPISSGTSCASASSSWRSPRACAGCW